MSVRAPATGPEQLAAVLDAAQGDVRALVARTERRLEEVAEQGGEALAAPAGDTLAAGGKRLRPILVFLAAGDGGSDDLVRAAVAVELVHMATLVHDDVLDRAPLRRGRPTVFAASGRGAATATGDMLFSRAFAELTATADREAVRELSEASSALARGELLQREDAFADELSVERYMERCELKTARLFEAACKLGAIFGAPGPDAAPALGRFGSEIGVAFQLFDDVLDVAGPVERTGKPRGTDLVDGTVTLPLIFAQRLDRELVTDLRPQTPEEAEQMCERIVATGALDAVKDVALARVENAKRALESVPSTDRQRHALELVADGVVERYG